MAQRLQLSKATLYLLISDYTSEEQPAVIAELAKHATRKILTPKKAEQIMWIGQARYHYGDRPDATLRALAQYNYEGSSSFREEIDALLAANPETDEAASAITDPITKRHNEQFEREWRVGPESMPLPSHQPQGRKAEPLPGDIGPMVPPIALVPEIQPQSPEPNQGVSEVSAPAKKPPREAPTASLSAPPTEISISGSKPADTTATTENAPIMAAEVTRFADKLVKLNIDLARELKRILCDDEAATQLRMALDREITIAANADGLDIPAYLRRSPQALN